MIEEKEKYNTEWSNASQKHKQESAVFSRDKSVQKEALPSHKQWDHAYEW